MIFWGHFLLTQKTGLSVAPASTAPPVLRTCFATTTIPCPFSCHADLVSASRFSSLFSKVKIAAKLLNTIFLRKIMIHFAFKQFVQII